LSEVVAVALVAEQVLAVAVAADKGNNTISWQ